MAGRKEYYNAQNTLKRLNEDVRLSEDTMAGLEATLVAHAFAGNMGDFTTMMTAISKTGTIAALEGKIDAVTEAVGKLRKAGQQPVKQAVSNDVDPITQLTHNIKREFNMVHKRISKIEKGGGPKDG